MAIVLDINILCKKMLSLNLIEELIGTYEVTINSISSIDTWEWENEQQIEFLQIKDAITRGKIIIIKLKSHEFKDLGVYIEKMNDIYLYTLWINTEGYPELDCDKISAENRTYYEIIYQEILKVNRKYQNLFEIVGIGLETNFCCDENIINIICRSKNVMVWIVNNDINLEDVLINYKKIEKGLGIIIYEKSIV